MGLLYSRLYHYFSNSYRKENLQITGLTCFCLSCNLYDPHKHEHFKMLQHLENKYKEILLCMPTVVDIEGLAQELFSSDINIGRIIVFILYCIQHYPHQKKNTCTILQKCINSMPKHKISLKKWVAV